MMYTWQYDPKLRIWVMLLKGWRLVTRELLIGYEYQVWRQEGVGQWTLEKLHTADSILKAQNAAIETVNAAAKATT